MVLKPDIYICLWLQGDLGLITDCGEGCSCFPVPPKLVRAGGRRDLQRQPGNPPRVGCLWHPRWDVGQTPVLQRSCLLLKAAGAFPLKCCRAAASDQQSGAGEECWKWMSRESSCRTQTCCGAMQPPQRQRGGSNLPPEKGLGVTGGIQICHLHATSP